jgi:hypothetical protein
VTVLPKSWLISVFASSSSPAGGSPVRGSCQEARERADDLARKEARSALSVKSLYGGAAPAAEGVTVGVRRPIIGCPGRRLLAERVSKEARSTGRAAGLHNLQCSEGPLLRRCAASIRRDPMSAVMASPPLWAGPGGPADPVRASQKNVTVKYFLGMIKEKVE